MYDIKTESARDNRLSSRHPVVILIVLAILLRRSSHRILLFATVVLSFCDLWRVRLVFEHVLRLRGTDPSFPRFAFGLLVALGIDYNIFLMTRVRGKRGSTAPRRHPEGARRHAA